VSNCAVTLALAYGSSQPYVSQHLRLAPVDGFVDGTFWVTTGFEEIPLTNPPGVVNLERGQIYGFIEPDGTQVFKEIPNLASANYADIAPTIVVPPGIGVLGDVIVAGAVSGGPLTKAALLAGLTTPGDPQRTAVQGIALVNALIYGG